MNEIYLTDNEYLRANINKDTKKFSILRDQYDSVDNFYIADEDSIVYITHRDNTIETLSVKQGDILFKYYPIDRSSNDPKLSNSTYIVLHDDSFYKKFISIRELCENKRKEEYEEKPKSPNESPSIQQFNLIKND